eukprot:139407-Rhodomonas_salina.1
MLEQGRWQAPNRVELNELRVDRRNPNFSLFFPAHFARFWTRNPAEVRRAAWARGLGGECAGWGEGRLVPRGRGGEDADVVGWEVGDVETRLCREGTRTLPSARTAP